MVRLCIASVDPAKLSSQCVMCNRREFPLTVIDCTGITKVNDLIAEPLSVQEAKCLIYNCRRQVPQIKPEPYHGSANNAANYHRAASASNYHHHHHQQHQQQLPGLPSGEHALGGGGGLAGGGPAMALPPHGPFNSATSSSRLYEMMAPSLMYGPTYGNAPINSNYLNAPFMNRFGFPSPTNTIMPSGYSGPQSSLSSYNNSPIRFPRGLIGGPNMMSGAAQHALPYALLPATSSSLLPFGSRKYKAALVPLF